MTFWVWSHSIHVLPIIPFGISHNFYHNSQCKMNGYVVVPRGHTKHPLPITLRDLHVSVEDLHELLRTDPESVFNFTLPALTSIISFYIFAMHYTKSR